MSTLEDMQAARAGALPLRHGDRRGAERTVPWLIVGLGAAAADFILLGSMSSLIGQAYYALVLGKTVEWRNHLELGAAIGLLVTAALWFRGAYGRRSLANVRSGPSDIGASLGFGMMTLLAVMFLTKSSSDYSRSVVLLAFTAAFPLMLLLRSIDRVLIRQLVSAKRLQMRQVMLVGVHDRIRETGLAEQLADAGCAIAGRAALDRGAGDAEFMREVELLSSAARIVRPDSILLCLPWEEAEKLRVCISVLSEHPASIHVDSDPYLGVLSGQRDDPLGFLVIGPPLTPAQLAAKRLFDIAMASAALCLAAPVMIAAAVAIRLESSGPVLFTQQRYGYNREPFRIFKFRTMHVQKSGGFRQAAPNDDRITRVGRWLRRTNIDELPQILNVLVGDMSLVGPRPHPIELDRQFTPLINRYTQRHRVRPGITGWAQVNGFRGETDTTDKMQGRIAHDLYYLGNWSFWLDLRIMLMTLLSATAYRNAR